MHAGLTSTQTPRYANATCVVPTLRSDKQGTHHARENFNSELGFELRAPDAWLVDEACEVIEINAARHADFVGDIAAI